MIDESLDELGEIDREAIVLRYFEDLSEAQAAEVLGCSVGTVKSTTSRALDRLRHVLDPDQLGAIHLDSHGTTDTNGVNDHEPATRL